MPGIIDFVTGFGPFVAHENTAAWSGGIPYQATTVDSMSRWLGWTAIVAGVAILALAWYRRQSRIRAANAVGQRFP